MQDLGDTSQTWQVYHEDFNSILGSSPEIELLLQIDEYPFAHEAGVFFAHANELFITSNQFRGDTCEKRVQISKVSLGGGTEPTKLENIDCDLIHFANGGVNYKDGILFCAQGSGTSPSGLFYMRASPPY